MRHDVDNAPDGLEDEAAFEASLISDVAVQGPAADGTDHSILLPETRPSPPSPGVKQPAWAGKTMGHFRLMRLIGQGAMGMVIQALDVNLRRVVALKVLRKRVAGMDEAQKVRQFLREAQAAAQIEHPHVVRVHEINQHDGWWYIAMEMLEGETLQRVVKAAGPLPPSRACPVIADAAIALAAVHEMGILHRDVKPSNLFITRGGRCKLTDFGLVRLGDSSEPTSVANKSVGTPHFMAPEVIRGEAQTPAIDVYGLGASLYYALAGKPPYVGKTVTDVCQQHLNSPVPDARHACPDCPASLAELVRRAMAKTPQFRPSAADLAAALRAEALDWRMDESGTATKLGSTVLSGLPLAGGVSGVAAGSRHAPAVGAFRGAMRWLKSRWRWVSLAAATVAISTAALLYTFGGRTGKPGQSSGMESGNLTDRFPEARGTYGVLPPGSTPMPIPLDTPPAFSWKGKAQTSGIKFVASKHGRHFYPIDDPAAIMISLENFVGYKTADDARADGKILAP